MRHVLNTARPTMTVEIGANVEAPSELKHVSVEIIEIVNPQRHSLSFDVRYRDESSAESLLGSFAPYPADNPGKFVVPTHGRLRAGGTVTITLAGELAQASDSVQVTIGPIRFTR